MYEISGGPVGDELVGFSFTKMIKKVAKVATKPITAPIKATISVAKNVAKGNIKGAVKAAVKPITSIAKDQVKLTKATAGAAKKVVTSKVVKSVAKVAARPIVAPIKATVKAGQQLAKGNIKGALKAAVKPITSEAKRTVKLVKATAINPALATAKAASQVARGDFKGAAGTLASSVKSAATGVAKSTGVLPVSKPVQSYGQSYGPAETEDTSFDYDGEYADADQAFDDSEEYAEEEPSEEEYAEEEPSEEEYTEEEYTEEEPSEEEYTEEEPSEEEYTDEEYTEEEPSEEEYDTAAIMMGYAGLEINDADVGYISKSVLKGRTGKNKTRGGGGVAIAPPRGKGGKGRVKVGYELGDEIVSGYDYGDELVGWSLKPPKWARKGVNQLTKVAMVVGPLVATVYPPAAPFIAGGLVLLKAAQTGDVKAIATVAATSAAAASGDPKAQQALDYLQAARGVIENVQAAKSGNTQAVAALAKSLPINTSSVTVVPPAVAAVVTSPVLANAQAAMKELDQNVRVVYGYGG